MIGVLSYAVFFASIVLILAVLALGLNLQWGYTGLFNAGVAGFYAIGGYAYAIMTAAPKPDMIGHLGWHWTFGILAAMVASALAAWIVGLATIRLRDDYLAIATFGIATTIQLVALNWESLTGGAERPRRGAASDGRGVPDAVRLQSVLPCASRRRRPAGLLSRSNASSALHGAAS